MRKLARLAFGLCLLAVTAAAQTMIEYAAAAATGTTGAAAGKSVSKGIDGIFGKLNQQSRQAAKNGPAPAARSITPAKMPAADPMAPSVASPRSRRPLATVASTQPVPLPSTPEEPAPIPAAEPGPAAPPVVATVEELRKIEPGASREAVLARLGKPGSTISMPQEGGLGEIFSYFAERRLVGKVRLIGGVVTSVEPAEQ